jgi:hypothetical protein
MGIKHSHLLALVVAVMLVVSACGGESRPSAVEWQAGWEEVQALVPDPVDLGVPPDKDLCGEAHVGIRYEAQQLVPTPDPIIDDAFQDWTEVATGMFFECPPHEPGMQGFDEAYVELARFAAEVDAVLVIDLQGFGVQPSGETPRVGE